MATVPKELGPWKIGRKLGQGEYGAVYECSRKDGKNEQDGRQWAMKLCPFMPPVVKGKEKPAQTACRALHWENQIYSLHLCNNPLFPIRPVKDSYGANQSDWRFLVMERFNGGTLADRLKAHGGFTPEATFSVGLRLLESLRVLHLRQYLFRDIKPENVMTFHAEDDAQGRGAVFVDFGAATKFTTLDGKHLEAGGTLVGTPTFVSIHVHDQSIPGRRDDLESLAYLLAWMLDGGSLPWSKARSEAEMISLKKSAESRKQLAEVSPVVGMILKNVMALKEPEAKPDYEGIARLLVGGGGKATGPIQFSLQSGKKKTPLRRGSHGKASSRSKSVDEEIEDERPQVKPRSSKTTDDDDDMSVIAKAMSEATTTKISKGAKGTKMTTNASATVQRNAAKVKSKSGEIETSAVMPRPPSTKSSSRKSHGSDSALDDSKTSNGSKSRKRISDADESTPKRMQPARSAKAGLIRTGMMLTAAALVYSAASALN